MPKRKSSGAAGSKLKNEITRDADGDDNMDSGSDLSEINVSFDFFDFKPQDFQGIKTLLRQLFDTDSDFINLSTVTDSILGYPEEPSKQCYPAIGTTVKSDGEEGDPYAFLTMVDLSSRNKDTSVVEEITTYISRRAKTNSQLEKLVNVLQSPSDKDSSPMTRVGLILSERLINMPTEVIPPLYTMLVDEMKRISTEGSDVEKEAVKDYSHYLILSRTYIEVMSNLPNMITEDDEDDANARPKKKQKSSTKKSAEVFYFHPEDEVLQKYALCHGDWDFEKQVDGGSSDSKRAFQDAGIKPKGHAILIEAGKFEEAIKAMHEYVGGSLDS